MSASTSSQRRARRAGRSPRRRAGSAGDSPRTLEVGIGAVRDEHEPRENEEVGEDARASVRDERQSDSGERDDAQDPADDDERLEREAEREARGEQLREAVTGEDRDAEAAEREDHVDEQEAGGADQPELLRERGVDEVGVQVGDDLAAARVPEGAETEPGAAHAAVRDRIERLPLLVALAVLAKSLAATQGAVDLVCRPRLD